DAPRGAVGLEVGDLAPARAGLVALAEEGALGRLERPAHQPLGDAARRRLEPLRRAQQQRPVGALLHPHLARSEPQIRTHNAILCSSSKSAAKHRSWGNTRWSCLAAARPALPRPRRPAAPGAPPPWSSA